VNSAVYTTFSPLAPRFWHQSLIDARPLSTGFFVPANNDASSSVITWQLHHTRDGIVGSGRKVISDIA
jgi:hypothetical protein